MVLEGCRCESSNGLGLVLLSNMGIGDRLGVKGGVWVDGACMGIWGRLGVKGGVWVSGVCVSDRVEVERVRVGLLVTGVVIN